MAKSKSKKAALGKGIAALLQGIDAESVTTNELAQTDVKIPISQIEVNPFQPRSDFDKEKLKELSDSIKIHGVIQPITVRMLGRNAFQLIAGERRLRASKLAGLKDIPAYIRTADDQEMLELALIENIQRQELNPIEIAQNYQRLIDECDLTHEELGKRLGKSRSATGNFLGLLKLPPAIQLGLKSKVIAMGHAKCLIGVNKADVQLALYEEIKSKQLSVRQAEELVRTWRNANNSKSNKTSNSGKLPVHLQKVQDQLAAHFETKVIFKRNTKGKGQLSISFNNDDDLNRILDLLNL